MQYHPTDIEEKWLAKWQQTPPAPIKRNNAPPFYMLEMFPYPSGYLHMGHVRNYTIGDCLARFKQLQGFDVFHPIGFDSFGLPAENAAIKNQIDPEAWTLQNMEAMRVQFKRLGLSYNWESEVKTCIPDYYRWNQWIFVQMMKKGLVYRKKGRVNWDPVDQTVLANEQVIDGKGWRSGALVEKKEIEQWFIKITDYAEELLADLDNLPHWPDSVKTMQRNWIGKSTGLEITFKIEDSTGKTIDDLTVFTTRPDTLMGVTYLAVAAEHPLVETILKTHPEKDKIQSFLTATINKSQIERTDDSEKNGVHLGCFAINPATGDKVPVLVADYVLMEYGTGAVMAVPCHDIRDYAFSKKYNLSHKEVIHPQNDTHDFNNDAFTAAGILVNSGKFTGLDNETAKTKISEWAEEKGFGKRVIKYRLKDWLISRQRYWGTPIPVLYDENNDAYPVDEAELPVLLPKDVSFTGQGNPIATSDSFRNVTQNGKIFRRETDTMDTFFDSSWYFLRYLDAHNDTRPFEAEKANHWLPVHQYVGGIEHATMHLLYARFFTKVLRDLGLTNINEPFDRLLCQGMVLKDGGKMSKSVGNTVDPSEIISKYGADTARVFILFGAPVERDLEWSDKGVEGCFRFLGRVFRLVSTPTESANASEITKLQHKTIKGVTEDIERFSYNTAISKLMEFVNAMTSQGSTPEALQTLVILIAPFAPFLAEELWSLLGHKDSVSATQWPVYDEALTIDDMITIVGQINGKVREKFELPRDLDKAKLEKIVTQNERIQKFIGEAQIVKVIVVPNKLVNIVIR